VQDAKQQSLEQIRAFLEASQEIRFQGEGRAGVYAWITPLLREQGYRQQGRAGKGLLRRYLAKMTGRSRAQITRLLGQYRVGGEVKATPYRRHRFPTRYTRADVELLAAVDEAHETLNGPATRQIVEREWKQYQHGEYQRLAGISVAQLYRLRQRPAYRQRRLHFTKTQPTPCRSASGGGRTRKVARAMCGWTRCTKGIATASRASITSMRWTK